MGIVTTVAAPARANAIETALAVVVASVVITDVTFATYGIAVAGKGQLPSKGCRAEASRLAVTLTAGRLASSPPCPRWPSRRRARFCGES
jgi:hypothetical protein